MYACNTQDMMFAVTKDTLNLLPPNHPLETRSRTMIRKFSSSKTASELPSTSWRALMRRSTFSWTSGSYITKSPTLASLFPRLVSPLVVAEWFFLQNWLILQRWRCLHHSCTTCPWPIWSFWLFGQRKSKETPARWFPGSSCEGVPLPHCVQITTQVQRPCTSLSVSTAFKLNAQAG